MCVGSLVLLIGALVVDLDPRGDDVGDRHVGRKEAGGQQVLEVPALAVGA